MSALVYRICALVYRICALLSQVLARVPLGTDLGLLHLTFALISGRFLSSRGALAGLDLAPEAVRRAAAALCYGRWQTADLLTQWRQAVAGEGHFTPCQHEGVRPVACDLTAFFRPRLRGPDGRPRGSKHFVSQAGKALPAVVLGLCAAVGQVGYTRLGLPRLVLRRGPGESEADLQRRLVTQAAHTLAPTEALVVDAGFGLAGLLGVPGLRFVARARANQTARRNVLPAYKGRGREPLPPAGAGAAGGQPALVCGGLGYPRRLRLLGSRGPPDLRESAADTFAGAFCRVAPPGRTTAQKGQRHGSSEDGRRGPQETQGSAGTKRDGLRRPIYRKLKILTLSIFVEHKSGGFAIDFQ